MIAVAAAIADPVRHDKIFTWVSSSELLLETLQIMTADAVATSGARPVSSPPTAPRAPTQLFCLFNQARL